MKISGGAGEARHPRDWRTSLLGALEAAAGSMVLCATLLAQQGQLAVPVPTIVVVGCVWLACAAWCLLRRRLGEGEALAQMCAIAVLLSVQAAVLDDPTWRRTALALLAVVPVAGVLFLRRSRLALLTGVAAAGTVTSGLTLGLAPAVAAYEVTAEVICLVTPALVTHLLTERVRALQAKAERDALTDSLTGLLNRRGLAEGCGEVVRDAARRGLVMGVAVADLDAFKAVNDTWGHATGDRLLVATAQTVRSQVRSGDLAVRLGGEELAVVGAWRDAEELAQAAERLRAAVAAQDVPDVPRITVSIGTAIVSPAEERSSGLDEVALLLDEADRGLYAAKRAGRDCVRHSPRSPRSAADVR